MIFGRVSCFFGILVLYANSFAVAGGYILDVGYLCYLMVELDDQLSKLIRYLISFSFLCSMVIDSDMR